MNYIKYEWRITNHENGYYLEHEFNRACGLNYDDWETTDIVHEIRPGGFTRIKDDTVSHHEHIWTVIQRRPMRDK